MESSLIVGPEDGPDVGPDVGPEEGPEVGPDVGFYFLLVLASSSVHSRPSIYCEGTSSIDWSTTKPSATWSYAQFR